MKLSIDLSAAQTERLRAEAERLGLTPEELARAAALCLALLQGHAFLDGNKRVGHAAMETFLVLNGAEIDAPVSDQERVMLDLASGRIERIQLAEWLRQHLKPLA